MAPRQNRLYVMINPHLDSHSAYKQVSAKAHLYDQTAILQNLSYFRICYP